MVSNLLCFWVPMLLKQWQETHSLQKETLFDAVLGHDDPYKLKTTALCAGHTDAYLYNPIFYPLCDEA